MSKAKKEIKEWLPYNLNGNRELYKKPHSIEEIIDIYNKKLFSYRCLERAKEKEGELNEDDLKYLKMLKEEYESEKATIEHSELIKKILNNDTLYFADYQFYEDTFKRIEYEPFTTIFETSGKIIVENDLRSFFQEGEDFDINATKGIVQTMEFYAKQGMLHGFVGNSCPGIFLSEKHGQIDIGANHDEDYETVLPDDSYEQITSVCTDLWWYSIVDLEHFKKLHPDVDTSNFDIVDIPAGTWELSHKYGISSKGYHEDLPYATLKLVNKRRKLIEKVTL